MFLLAEAFVDAGYHDAHAVFISNHSKTVRYPSCSLSRVHAKIRMRICAVDDGGLGEGVCVHVGTGATSWRFHAGHDIWKYFG